MGGLYSSIEESLKRVKPEEWYSKESLLDLGLRPIDGKPQYLLMDDGKTLGASVRYHYERTLGLDLEASLVDTRCLSMALGSEGLYAFLAMHPEMVAGPPRFVNGMVVQKVRCDELGKLSELQRSEHLEPYEKDSAGLIDIFDLGWDALSYIKEHRAQSIDEIAAGAGQPPCVVRGAMVVLGYRKLPDRDELARLGREIYDALHPGTRPWDVGEERALRECYHFMSPEFLSQKLHRKRDDIEYQARLLGLSRFNQKDYYCITDVLRISGISYQELQEALFSGALAFKRYKIDSDDMPEESDPLPFGAVLISGGSLLDYFSKGERAKAEKTRILKHLLEGESPGREAYHRVMEYYKKNPRKVIDLVDFFHIYSKIPPLRDPEEERELARLKDTDLLKRNDLIECHYRYGLKYAYRRKGFTNRTSLALEDILQEVLVGMMKGIDKYSIVRTREDNGEPHAVMTCATWWMYQNVYRVYTASGLIRMPTEKHQLRGRINRFIGDYVAENGRMPGDNILKEKFGESLHEIKKIIRLGREMRSLNTQMGGEGDESEFWETVPGRSERPIDILIPRSQAEVLAQAVEQLPLRQRFVLQKLYGLNGDRSHTLEEVGEELNLSRERVRQVEENALKQLGKDQKLRTL